MADQPLLGTGRWLQTNGEAICNGSSYLQSLVSYRYPLTEMPVSADNTTGFPFGRNISECSSDTVGARGDQSQSLTVDKCYTMSGGNVFVIYLHWPTAPGTAVSTQALFSQVLASEGPFQSSSGLH